MLDQLSQCEEKLLKLLEELDGKDLEEVLNQMEEEEVLIHVSNRTIHHLL